MLPRLDVFAGKPLLTRQDAYRAFLFYCEEHPEVVDKLMKILEDMIAARSKARESATGKK